MHRTHTTQQLQMRNLDLKQKKVVRNESNSSVSVFADTVKI